MHKKAERIAVAIAVGAIIVTSCSARNADDAAQVASTAPLEVQHELFEACGTGNLSKVQSMLGTMPGLANARASNTKDSPLMRAAENGQEKIVSILLKSGADPNAADYHGRTALISAAYIGNAEIVESLLNAGASPNALDDRYGFTPLLNAAWKGHTSVVRLLLAAGADPNVRAKDGSTALERAESGNHAEIVNLLTNAR